MKIYLLLCLPHIKAVFPSLSTESSLAPLSSKNVMTLKSSYNAAFFKLNHNLNSQSELLV